VTQSYTFEVSGHFSSTDVDMRGPIPNANTDPRYVNVSLRVTNRATSPMSFTFLTTQRFDIELVNGAGAVLTRWSQGRAFGDIVMTEQLAPKQSWDFEGPLPLFDTSFGWVPSGQYTVRAFVTAGTKPSVLSPLQFQIGLLGP
jgi:hypothetical protein